MTGDQVGIHSRTMAMADVSLHGGDDSHSRNREKTVLQGIAYLDELRYTILFALLALALHFYMKRPKGVPPGPNGLPLLGYAPYLGARPHEKLLEVSKTYGNIFSIYIGQKLAIILNDYEALTKAYVENADAVANRDPGFAHKVLNGSEHDSRIRGVTMTNGEHWRTMRRFALTTLRNLGMGKSRLQERILEEVDHLTNTLRKKEGLTVDPDELMIESIANIMFAVTFNKRFDHADPTLKVIVDFLVIALPTLSNVGPVQRFPWLRKFGKFKRFWNSFLKDMSRFKKILRDEVAAHAEVNETDEPYDYVSAFRQQQMREAKLGQKVSYFDEDELLVNLSNMFGAGAETTAATITWAFYFMVLHPDIQRKTQAVIDAKVERNRNVTMDDKVELPYVEAFCQEVQRLGNVVPLNIPRSAAEDLTVLGYHIPKGSFIMSNLWHIHRDPRYWDNPEQFIPERFLDEEGRLRTPPHFIPFSIGKRHCPGESLARMEIFLFVTNILQKFTLTIPEGTALRPPEEYISGVASRPPHFKVIFEPKM